MRYDAKLMQLKRQLLIEHGQELLLFFDKYGMITEFNRCAADSLGYEDEFYQMPIYDIFRKSCKLENERLVINHKLQLGAVETVAYRKNQTCFAVKLKLQVLVEGKCYIGICLAKDISERKKLYRELKQAKHEAKIAREYKSEFIANITHELKTPVNGIKGLTEELLETELTPRQLENLNIIRRCCDSMNTLINNLLDFTKLGNNKLVLEKRVFSFRKLINEVISINMLRINEKGLKLIVSIANDIPDNVIGDECRLSQVLNNLFSNAIKFTSVGQIGLEVVKTNQTEKDLELFFIVMDTGIGISATEKDKLFQSFTQVDSSITRRFGGTGLGLSICKMLVKAMDGSITFDSEKNKGSTFSFSVRLGIAKGSKVNQDYDYNSKYTGNNSEYQDSKSENNYLEQFLEGYNFTLAMQQSEDTEVKYIDIIIREIQSDMEKLRLCFDMSNWTKAEEIAYSLRKRIPEEFKLLKNKAFLLLLEVRKEEYEKSLQLLNELADKVKEVVSWKI